MEVLERERAVEDAGGGGLQRIRAIESTLYSPTSM